MAEMIAQGLNNLNNSVKNQNTQSTKKSNKTEGKDSLAVLVSGNEKTKKTFKQLLKENDSKKAGNSEKIDFSKLLDALNLSSEELKEKLKNMDKNKLRDMEKMVQLAFASILEKLSSEDKLKNMKELGISKELLNKVKSKLGFMQKLISSQKEIQKSKNQSNDEILQSNDEILQSNDEILKLNNSNLNKMAKLLDLSKDELKAFKTKINNLSNKEFTDLKQILADNNNLNKEEINNMAELLDLSKDELKALKAKINNLNNQKINELKNLLITDKDKNLIQNNILEKNINKENISKTEKVYYQTLKKQANAENNKAKQVSLGLKDKGKNLAASQLNSELKANLDLKELNKRNDLKKLLNRDNLNTSENKVKTSTTNTKQDSSFSNLFSGNQQQNNFTNLFGMQNMNSTSNFSLGENSPQFSNSVLQGRELAKQVTEQIKLINKPANNEINLQLEPEFLGKVKMNLKVDDGKVTARFMVDNILVKSHLDQNISQLKSTLINQGFNVDNLEVNAEDSGYDMGREDGSNQFFQEENQNQHKRKFNYHEYDKIKDELMDLSPEELEKIIENDPKKLRNWGYVQQNDWFSYGGHYQRMNLLA